MPHGSEIAVPAGPDPDRFRQALGLFATGVTVVTALDPNPTLSLGPATADADPDAEAYPDPDADPDPDPDAEARADVGAEARAEAGAGGEAADADAGAQAEAKPEARAAAEGRAAGCSGAGGGGGRPVGFACQAFAALSLEPPLVLFCPSKTSGTWPAIERAGHFCINVLGASQRHVSQTFGTPGEDRFGSIDWHLSPGGAPIIDGVLTWIDCVIDNVYAAGDHYVVIGHVTALESPGSADGAYADERPLLFYRGTYTATELVPSAGPDGPAPPHAIVQALRTWPPHQDWL